MRWVARMAPLFAVFWLVLSGHLEPLLLVLGALSVALVCWLSVRAGLPARETVTIPLALRLPRYLLWLAKEVLVSAIAVVRKAWSPRLALEPVVEATPSPEMSALTQVVYANSITFTPGTLSLDLDDDRIRVHSLEPADVESLRAGRMLRHVRRLEASR